MDPQILVPTGKTDESAILKERNQEVKMRSAPKTRDSFFDSLRPRLPDNVRPFYEDRVLVRRIDQSAENMKHAPECRYPISGEVCDCEILIASPELSERERTGPQMGVVVAVGSGATGYGMLPAPGSAGPDSTPRRHKWKPFAVKFANFGADVKVGERVEFQMFVTKHPTGKRAEFQVKPGDTVWYERVPPNEFVRDGELYTFLYEDQHVIGIVE